ncbi:ABC transporter ATP-binding protein [Acidobacteriota bacterium]
MTAQTKRTMSVLRRLYVISKHHRVIFIVGLSILFITTLLETGVIPILFTCLLFLVLGSESFASSGFSLEIGSYDIGRFLNDKLASDDRFVLLIKVSCLIIFMLLLKCGGQARQSYLMHKFAYRVAMDLRQRLFAHVLRLSPAQYETTSSGSLLSRITHDVAVLQECLGPPLSEFAQAPIAITIALGMMLVLSWKLTLAAICLAPLIALLIAVMGRVIRRLSVTIQDRMAALNDQLSQILSGIRIIQSFTLEPFQLKRTAKLNRQYYRDAMKSVLVNETLAPGIEFIAVVGIIAGVVIGGFAVLRYSMPPESFVLFVLMAQQAGNKFTRLARMNSLRQRVNGAGTRIFEIMDIEPAIGDAPHAEPLPEIEGRVTFEKLSFNYGNGEDVLSEIDLTVSPGEMIALVGPSGAGKTTLVNLLLRFYDPTAGRILVDGHDIRHVILSSLRKQIGMVPQETVLFSGTIEENIRFGRPDASIDEVTRAAQAANVLEFAQSMPRGLQSQVSERGVRLSGGQRQRVAIARAVLKNPGIFILDEATSSLDTEGEQLVQQALGRLMRGRTTFVIAHRLSTVQHADRILVLDGGRIIEIGSHEHLLAQGGLYSRLYHMQFSNRRDGEHHEP